MFYYIYDKGTGELLGQCDQPDSAGQVPQITDYDRFGIFQAEQEMDVVSQRVAPDGQLRPSTEDELQAAKIAEGKRISKLDLVSRLEGQECRKFLQAALDDQTGNTAKFLFTMLVGPERINVYDARFIAGFQYLKALGLWETDEAAQQRFAEITA